jgi:hypothetical protein
MNIRGKWSDKQTVGWNREARRRARQQLQAALSLLGVTARVRVRGRAASGRAPPW